MQEVPTTAGDKQRQKPTQPMTRKCHLPFELLRYDDHGVVFSTAIGRVDDFLFGYQSKGRGKTRLESGDDMKHEGTFDNWRWGVVGFPGWVESISWGRPKDQRQVDGGKYKTHSMLEWTETCARTLGTFQSVSE